MAKEDDPASFWHIFRGEMLGRVLFGKNLPTFIGGSLDAFTVAALPIVQRTSEHSAVSFPKVQV